MQRIHFFVSGRVQGVAFRYFTNYKANKLKIKGWVKNLNDGRVEVVAEGKKEKIKKFLSALKKGTDLAKVDNIDIKEEEYTGEFKEFKIAF